jgi:hypothetical protein
MKIVAPSVGSALHFDNSWVRSIKIRKVVIVFNILN